MNTTRGYFGIGIYNGKTPKNIGTLWRLAASLGASFIFTIGTRYQHQATDTTKADRHMPLFHYDDFAQFLASRPTGCRLVGVELDEMAVPATAFVHPERCIYLLGAEDTGLPVGVLNQCDSIVQLPGNYCLNVSVAGSIMLYDRLLKRQLISTPTPQ